MLKKKGWQGIAIALAVWSMSCWLFAVPLKINYQGRLTNNNSAVTATKTMYFSIKETSGGTTVWGPVEKSVSVVNGLYNVVLEPDTAVFATTQQLQLHIKVDSVDLSPDIQLLAVPYSYRAKASEQAETVTPDSTAGNSVISALNAASKTVPSGAFVGSTDTQTLTNKTLSTGNTWNGNTVGLAYGGTGSTTGSITGTGALTFAAGGTNQNVALTPSGTGAAVLNGNVYLTSSSALLISPTTNNSVEFQY